MKDFRILVKVNPAEPEKALKFLSEKLTGDPWLLRDTDIDFVKKQDYITAVPIEIALDMETRAKLSYLIPGIRVIVTGVPACRVKSLQEYGYTAFNLDAKLEDKDEEVEDPIQKPVKKKEPEEKKEVVEEEKSVCKEKEEEYFFNGKKITKDEFNGKVAEFLKLYKDMFKNFS